MPAPANKLWEAITHSTCRPVSTRPMGEAVLHAENDRLSREADKAWLDGYIEGYGDAKEGLPPRHETLFDEDDGDPNEYPERWEV